MKEYLEIRNFGPIVEAELDDIRPLCVLIGESGSGKSTIMKVLSLFRWIYKRVNLRSYLKHAKIKRTQLGFKIKPLLRTSGILEYLKPDSLIVYRRDGYEIRMENRSVNIRFTIAPDDLCLDKVCFISDKRSMIPDFIDNKMERRIANYYLQDTMDNFILAYKEARQLPLDFLGVNFKVEKPKNGPERLTIQGADGEDFIIEMKNASSGIQTVTPLALIVNHYASHYDAVDSMNSALFQYMKDTDNLKEFSAVKNVGEIERRTVHILVEEPELSLYPDSQKSLIDYLVERCFARPNRDYDMTLMMATHSPYIVNYLNLLIERNERQEDTPYKMAFENISAYEVSGGFVTSLKVESDHKLIDTRSLSQPISDIYEEYNNKTV